MKCNKLLKEALEQLMESKLPLGFHSTNKNFKLNDIKFDDSSGGNMFGPGAYFHISSVEGRPANLTGIVPKEFKNVTNYLRDVSKFHSISRAPTKLEKQQYNDHLVSQGYNSVLSYTPGHKVIANIIDKKFFKNKEWLDESLSKLDDYQGGLLDVDLTNTPTTSVDNLYRAQMPLNIEKDITKLHPGQIIEIGTNLSTTKNKAALRDFISYKIDQMENIFTPEEVQELAKKSSIIKIKGPGKGIDVNKLYKALGEKSMYEHEHEIVLPKGTKMQYIGKKTVGDLTVHELKLLSSVLGLPVATMYVGVNEGAK